MSQQPIANESKTSECKSPEAILQFHYNSQKQRMKGNPDFFTNQAKDAFTKFPGLEQALAKYLETPEDKRPRLSIIPYHDTPRHKYHHGLFLSHTPAFCPDNSVHNLCCHVLYELHKESQWQGANGLSLEVGGQVIVSIKAQPEGSSIYDDEFLLDAFENAKDSQYKQYWDNRPPVKKGKPQVKVQQAWVNSALREQPAGIACIAVSVLGCLGALMVSAQITDTNTVMIALFAASAALLIAGIVMAARACYANKKLQQRNPYWENYLDSKKDLTQLLPYSEN